MTYRTDSMIMKGIRPLDSGYQGTALRSTARRRLTGATLTAILVFWGASSASASFIGSSVTLDNRFPDLSTISVVFGTVTVDASVEYPSLLCCPPPAWLSDIGSTSIVLDHLATGNHLGSASFNGFVYSFAGAPTIGSVSVDPLSTLLPVSVTNSGTQIFVDYAGSGILEPSRTILNVSFIPEPATATLLGIGLSALACRRQRSSPSRGASRGHTGS